MFYVWPACALPLCRYNAYFVDLFVRMSNALAIGMYKKFGYIVYRQVIKYYAGEEDAYGTQSLHWHALFLCSAVSVDSARPVY